MTSSLFLTPVKPYRRRISYQAYLDLANDAQIMEWVNGEVITYMPPLLEHQNLVSYLNTILRLYAQLLQLGQIIPAPFAVQLWPDGPAREPDLFFLSQKNEKGLTAKQFSGAPDIVVEVVSPSSVTEDRVRKFSEYEKAGVREYWLIDPRSRQQQADFYTLDESGVYQPLPIAENGRFHSHILPGFWLNLDWLWQDPLPNTQTTFAEIVVEAEGVAPEIKQAYQTLLKTLKA